MKKTAIFLGIIVFGFFSAIQLSKIIILKPSASASDLTIENIINGINKERAIRNLPTLNTDSRLSLAGQYKAEDMTNRHYFSHTDPEGNYIWNKITENGYHPYLQLGENLAIEFFNTESLIQAWMNSPTHRANILNDGFKDQGMGLSFGDASKNQYSSSIANTFGTLLKPKPTQTPSQEKVLNADSPTPSVTPTPSPKISPTPLVTQTPIISTTPSPTQVLTQSTNQGNPKESLRGSEKLSQKDYVLPGEFTPNIDSNASKTPKSFEVENLNKNQSTLNADLMTKTVYRYFLLILSGIIVVFLISDLKKMFEEKFHAYDKKINNLILLILSIVVIGLIYWL